MRMERQNNKKAIHKETKSTRGRKKKRKATTTTKSATRRARAVARFSTVSRTNWRNYNRNPYPSIGTLNEEHREKATGCSDRFFPTRMAMTYASVFNRGAAPAEFFFPSSTCASPMTLIRPPPLYPAHTYKCIAAVDLQKSQVSASAHSSRPVVEAEARGGHPLMVMLMDLVEVLCTSVMMTGKKKAQTHLHSSGCCSPRLRVRLG
ncbi:hypothetical protein BJX63DRAFT_261827 [Aspergillus granulosus]|uniref:Uncharacterized protein n=1 Tax=Aspergillus granulosus TaxID=176169 RepID=A0ABR4H9D3_9EURO